jgi:hypothetical protein
MASMDARMPWPIAVPRDVTSESMARTRASVSSVGGTVTAAKPAKVTSPIREPSGCASMKSVAACWAASRRLGGTSVEHIDLETSRASRTVVAVEEMGTSR